MSEQYEMRALRLLSAYRDAKQQRNFTQMNAASDGFNDIILRVGNATRQQELRNMMTALIDASADEALAAYARHAEGVGALKNAFELQAKMIENANEGLFFPSSAKELAKLTGEISALKKSADALLSSADGLGEAFEKQDAIALIKEAMHSKTQLEDLLTKLRLIEDKMPQQAPS